MFSIDTFHEQYQTQNIPLVLKGRKFDMFLPNEIDRFIDTNDPMVGFPLWAKIWPASLVLAEYLANLPAETS